MMLHKTGPSPALFWGSRQQRSPSVHRPLAMLRATSQHSTDATPGAAFNPLLSAAIMMAPFVLPVEALAADVAAVAPPEHSLVLGTSAALLHPAIMFFLLASTGYSGYLGWQWRRTRTMPEQIKALKAQLPPLNAEGERPASPLDAQITALEQERKALIGGNFRDKHWQWSSLILAMGTGIAIEGASNTFIRTGKLFPGPHLYAGLFIVFIWSLAASLVPAMQKGNDTARTAHIGLNAINAGLFLWQVPTGLEIVEKVFQFTQWP